MTELQLRQRELELIATIVVGAFFVFLFCAGMVILTDKPKTDNPKPDSQVQTNK